MATILVVDDRLINRQLLLTLLGYAGHRILEASDGLEALKIVQAEPLDLVVSDIVMPTMDGVEFVKKLRADPTISNIPVIFYTATYRIKEAKIIAEACGVKFVLAKPAEPETILNAVNQALGIEGSEPAKYVPSEVTNYSEKELISNKIIEHLSILEDFELNVNNLIQSQLKLKEESDYLLLMQQKYNESLSKLQSLSLRLNALVEIGMNLASEGDPKRLSEMFCHAAHDMISSKYAVMGLLDNDSKNLGHLVIRGMNPEDKDRLSQSLTSISINSLGWNLSKGPARRLHDLNGDPKIAALPDSHPPIQSFLGVPIASPTKNYGWIYFADKLGAEEFFQEDEYLATILASQMAIAYENIRSNEQIRKLSQATAQQLQHLTALRTIDIAITGSFDLKVTLNILLDQVTSQLKIDAADVLLLNPYTQTLEYSAGRGFGTKAIEQSRIRLGEGYAGRAALERHMVHIADLDKEKAAFLRFQLLSNEKFISYYAVPLIAKGQVKGVLEVFHRLPIEANPDWINFLEALAGQAAIAIDNATLFNDLQRSNLELTLAYDTTIEGWSRALDLRDKETEGHSQRVTEMTLRLAQAMGIKDEELVHIRRGALLHDIGKMGIPDSILLKPGSFTDEEWDIMKKHPVYAYELLSPIAFLRLALGIPYCHHERWDGNGYPRKLKGEQIPLAARIFAIADVWDALRSDRPYRAAWSEEKAIELIKDSSGKHFDSKVVEVFLEMIKSG